MSVTLIVREGLAASAEQRDYELVCPHGRTCAAMSGLLTGSDTDATRLLLLRHLVQHRCACVQYEWHRGTVTADNLAQREVVSLAEDVCLTPI